MEQSKLKTRGLKMALSLIPDDMKAAAPKALEEYLQGRLREVEPMTGEAGAAYLMVPQSDDTLRIMLVCLDENSTVTRIVSQTSLADICSKIMDGLKKM